MIVWVAEPARLVGFTVKLPLVVLAPVGVPEIAHVTGSKVRPVVLLKVEGVMLQEMKADPD